MSGVIRGRQPERVPQGRLVTDPPPSLAALVRCTRCGREVPYGSTEHYVHTVRCGDIPHDRRYCRDSDACNDAIRNANGGRIP